MSIVCMGERGVENRGKKRNSAPKCGDVGIMKSEGGVRDARARVQTRFMIFNCFRVRQELMGIS